MHSYGQYEGGHFEAASCQLWTGWTRMPMSSFLPKVCGWIWLGIKLQHLAITRLGCFWMLLMRFQHLCLFWKCLAQLHLLEGNKELNMLRCTLNIHWTKKFNVTNSSFWTLPLDRLVGFLYWHWWKKDGGNFTDGWPIWVAARIIPMLIKRIYSDHHHSGNSPGATLNSVPHDAALEVQFWMLSVWGRWNIGVIPSSLCHWSSETQDLWVIKYAKSTHHLWNICG